MNFLVTYLGTERQEALATPPVFRICVQPRSLLVFTGEAYVNYFHEIQELTEDELTPQVFVFVFSVFVFVFLCLCVRVCGCVCVFVFVCLCFASVPAFEFCLVMYSSLGSTCSRNVAFLLIFSRFSTPLLRLAHWPVTLG